MPYRNRTYRRRGRLGQEERREEDRQFHLTVSIGNEPVSSRADNACLGSMNHFTMTPMNKACRTEPAWRATLASCSRLIPRKSSASPLVALGWIPARSASARRCSWKPARPPPPCQPAEAPPARPLQRPAPDKGVTQRSGIASDARGGPATLAMLRRARSSCLPAGGAVTCLPGGRLAARRPWLARYRPARHADGRGARMPRAARRRRRPRRRPGRRR
jgi:hypothetical protein